MYNGWSNYETWVCKLWLDNDEMSAQNMAEHASDALARGGAHHLSRYIKDSVEEMAPELDGMYSDLLTAAISEVNFYEIAESYIEDAKEAAEREEKEDNSCNQCVAMMINRVYCHESGCPNMGKVKIDGKWVDQDETDYNERSR